jgi:putative ATP-binding cassette transporter
MKRIIGVNRNLGFFTTGYNYMIQIIPALIVAPLFMRRETEFGAITQSAMAFSHLLGAFSLIVTQFSAISSYASVLARLDALVDRVMAPALDNPSLVFVEEPERLAYEKLTLQTAHDARVLVRDLDLDVKRGIRLVIRGHDPLACRALMRATAGVWSDGEGRIVRPALADVAFLPERPYLPPGTLRSLLSGDRETPTDAELRALLARLEAAHIVAYAEGLDIEHSWDKALSTRDRALLSVARLVLSRPRFAFIDNLGRTLGDEGVPAVLQILVEHEITVVVLDGVNGVVTGDAELLIAEDGSWRRV